MEKILFVDDDPALLKGLKRGLYAERKDWQMTFVENARQALELLARESYDIIVTDFRMPGMSGYELLTEISQRYPKMIRIILTGQPDMQSYADSINVCHYFLWKPLDISMMSALLQRFRTLHDILADDRLEEVINGLSALPTLPDVYVRLTALLNDPEGAVGEIADLIREDASLTMQVLKMVNSSFFGLVRTISTLDEALKFIGLNTLRSLILAHKIYALDDVRYTNLNGPLQHLWQHSIQTAQLSEGLVRGRDDRPFEAYASIAGILHDVGRYLIMTQMYDSWKEIQARGGDYLKAEYEVLGVSHAEIGAYLASLWGLPLAIVESIYFHHGPRPETCSGLQTIASAVWHANRISHGERSESAAEYSKLLSQPDLKKFLLGIEG